MMKRFVMIIAVALLAASVFAATYSYKNNTYQKLADEYTKKAQQAMDAGCDDFLSKPVSAALCLETIEKHIK